MGSKTLAASLTDVGTYSYSALCAVSLNQLFSEEHESSFKTKTLEEIVKHLGLSKQVAESITAMMENDCCDDPRAFADALLEEDCLQKDGLPVVTDMVTLAVSDGKYDARMRTLVKYVSWQLRISWDQVEEIESMLAESLEAREYQLSEEEEKEKKKFSRNKKIKRLALIGLATVGGGTLIGLTGGLAAPLVAAGAASIIGGAGAAALGSTAGVAIIGSLFGVAGAGLGGYKMKKRVGAVEEFKFEPLVVIGKQLHITVAVTGWLSKDMPDFKMPWQSLAESREQYSLRWETKYLIELGEAFEFILNGAISMATQEALKYTIVSGLITAVAWPAALVSAANVLDNPWNVCIQRATSTGKELAEVLLARQQGNRPVTLIGYSLGARVIFSCLEELVKRKGSAGIVEDVILLGAPVSGSVKQWEKLSHVVAGRIINGYCRGDWLLKFLFRTANVHFTTVAGLGPVKWDNRRMHNIDLSDVVTGHKDYLKQLPTIMKVVGIRTKEDVVRGKIPPHKLFPKSESCDSFTSSEEDGETGNGTQEKEAHKTDKSSKGRKGSHKKKGENDTQDKHKEETATGKEDSHQTVEKIMDQMLEDQNRVKDAGVSVENDDTQGGNGNSQGDLENTEGDEGNSLTDSQNQSVGNNNNKNVNSKEDSKPESNCDNEHKLEECSPEELTKLSINDPSQEQTSK